MTEGSFGRLTMRIWFLAVVAACTPCRRMLAKSLGGPASWRFIRIHAVWQQPWLELPSRLWPSALPIQGRRRQEAIGDDVHAGHVPSHQLGLASISKISRRWR